MFLLPLSLTSVFNLFLPRWASSFRAQQCQRHLQQPEWIVSNNRRPPRGQQPQLLPPGARRAPFSRPVPRHPLQQPLRPPSVSDLAPGPTPTPAHHLQPRLPRLRPLHHDPGRGARHQPHRPGFHGRSQRPQFRPLHRQQWGLPRFSR